MTRHGAHEPAGSQASIPFLDDARRNLALVRETYGRESTRYRHLVRRYRAVSNELGCRRALERILHPLRRRSGSHERLPWKRHARPQPHRSHRASWRRPR